MAMPVECLTIEDYIVFDRLPMGYRFRRRKGPISQPWESVLVSDCVGMSHHLGMMCDPQGRLFRGCSSSRSLKRSDHS
jgi:hypothetical protein